MATPLTLIGAPTSAGAYSPGQEKTPDALRAAGLVESLNRCGIDVRDQGNVPGFRWSVDRSNIRAMNAETVAEVAEATANRVAAALRKGSPVLVVGGDCTVEIGTVAGALHCNTSIGIVYIDLDTDLNTPESVDDGALDWMGVAHMLGVRGSVRRLTELGPCVPLLQPSQIHFFANDNSKPFEREIIESRGIAEKRLADVASDPTGAAQSIVDGWAKQFELLLVHLDVDVLDYLSMPLAENNRRNEGLRFEQLIAALRPLLCAPNWIALTVCEINPDHGEKDGSTMRTFTKALADVLSESPRIRGSLR